MDSLAGLLDLEVSDETHRTHSRRTCRTCSPVRGWETASPITVSTTPTVKC